MSEQGKEKHANMSHIDTTIETFHKLDTRQSKSSNDLHQQQQ